MKSEIANRQSEILECPCPLDHQIVDAVIAWAQSGAGMRDETWARVVDLLNRKTAEPSYAENAPRSAISTPIAVISREKGTSPICGGLRTGGEGLEQKSAINGKEIDHEN